MNNIRKLAAKLRANMRPICGAHTCTHLRTTQPEAAMSERKGKYALVGPTPGGYDWWAINDMEKMYAILSVQASAPHADEIIRFAWAQIASCPSRKRESELSKR